ncbi:MAG: ABC transporter substrate-binding protein [Anaerolineae bacterium]|nr:ABC transporter substrate-binding protein [Anaerolineae bacterium]
MIRRIAFVFLLSIMLSTVSVAQDDLQSERFLLTFVPNVQFSPLYVAVEQGYFEAAGYEISIEYLNEPDVVDLVAAGQANFGMVSGEQVIVAAARQRPIVYVYEWFQQYPIGLVVDLESDIQQPADLAGHKIGLPGRFGASYSGLTTMLMAAGLTERDVELQEIGFSAPDVFCTSGAIDAAIVYLNNEPLQIKLRASEAECGDVESIRVFAVSDSTDLVSNGIITSTALLGTDSQHVEDVVSAFDMGLRDVINNPARAYLLSESYVEGLPLSEALREQLTMLADEQDGFLATEPSREEIAATRETMLLHLQTVIDDPAELIQFQVLLASIDLWDADQLGYSDLASWESMQSTLIEIGSLDEAIDLSDIFTNQFVAPEE